MSAGVPRAYFLVEAVFLGAALAVAFGAALVAAGFLAAVLVVLVALALVVVFAAAGLASARRRARLGGGGLGGGCLGAGRLAQRGASLAGRGLGALRLAGLAGCDAGLGGLGRGGLAGRLDDAATGRDALTTERGVDLEGQARLAAGGGVRVDGTDLGGAIEGAERLGQSGNGVDRRIGGLCGSAQSLRDECLRGGSARLQDLVAALGLTDPLESGRRTSARPGAGRLGQVGNLD